ncbi:hypothetical protein [Pelosinus baikalensis]|uniref:Tail fiber protein n=1 Tax=Pelosinus baikalensis TaxID=2892015 RepID=A0ABS8HRW3_9FIRM|nr:hypothetical protein [Pelosinus baikalensis]MCC5464574.1 hypothetical protein [Pelosinus baikalensis]MCC5467517.1 hypothetical protein [Pelosinus baikalensis]
MQQTPNLNLNKPDGTDVVDITDLNANMDIIDGKLGITGHNHNGTAGNGPKITNAGLAAGAADDTAIGSRTVNQALASPANAGTITQLLSWLAGRIKAITGATNWYDAPAITLATINTLFGTSGHSHNGTTGQGPKIAYSNINGAPSSMTPTAHASTATTYGVSTAANYGHAMASSAAPVVAGTANAGTDNGKFAREGHVHPAQTSVSGNAGTATKLASARQIALTGAVTGAGNFDGSGNLSITTTAGTAASIVSSGSGVNYYWRKWSNGDMEIWGTITGNLGSMGSHTVGAAIAFPVQFPTVCKNVIISQPDWIGESAYIWRVLKDSKNISGFSVKEDRWDNKGAGNLASADYYAFGN